jgi:broad specificity phosphatase PhoE
MTILHLLRHGEHGLLGRVLAGRMPGVGMTQRGRAEIAAAAERLAARRPDLVAMDCMGYAPATKTIIRRVCRVPALLAITAAGRVVREMLD